jgi:hypothetical protein
MRFFTGIFLKEAVIIASCAFVGGSKAPQYTPVTLLLDV